MVLRENLTVQNLVSLKTNLELDLLTTIRKAVDVFILTTGVYLEYVEIVLHKNQDIDETKTTFVTDVCVGLNLDIPERKTIHTIGYHEHIGQGFLFPKEKEQ